MKLEALLALILVWMLSLIGAGWLAYDAGVDSELAAQAREDQARHATESVVATAIAAMKVNHVTHYQALEREVRTREVFRDCRSGPTAVELFNGAIAGKRAGHSVMPAASTPR